MSLSEPADRELIHNRDIECRGYRRSDGLWDIEGWLRDTKTYSFRNKYRGDIAVGEPVHEMWMRLTIDNNFVIQAAEASSDAFPYEVCDAITPDYKSLVGLQIGPNFRRDAKAVIGGDRGCSHLTKLLNNLVITAVQTMGPLLLKDHGGPDDESSGQPGETMPPHLGSCHALAIDGPVVREHYPRWYRQKPSK